MASKLRLAMTRSASSSSPAASSFAAVAININKNNNESNAPAFSSVATIKDLVTVRIVSINDVYDLTKLPR